MSDLEQLTSAIERASQQYHQLVLLVGPSRTGKTNTLRALAKTGNYRYCNINLELAQRLLELTRNQRARQIERLMHDIVSETATDVVILDNLELLFDTGLQIDPLRLLKSVSRNHTTVASWSGKHDDGLLTYAEPDHPEYKSYRNVEAITVLAGNETRIGH